MRNYRKLAVLCAAAALTACGQSNPPQQTYDAQGRPLPAQAQGDNGMLWGLGGFLLGRATAPSPAPQPQYAPAPAYEPPRQSFAPPAAAPVIGSGVKPPAPAPAQALAPAPAPAAGAPVKPTYSGPTGYSSVTQAAPTYKLPAPQAPAPKPALAPAPAPKPVQVAAPPAPKPAPAPAPKPSVSYSFKPSPAPAYRAPAPSPSRK